MPVVPLVPPGGDEDLVATPDRRFHDELAFTDRAIIEERPDEAVDRIAAVVFRDREFFAGAIGGGDDLLTAANGQRERFFAEGVQSEIEERGRDGVMRPRIGGAIGRFEPVRFPDHRGQIGEDRWACAEQPGGFIGQILGVLPVEIADRDQIDQVDPVRFEFREPGQMPSPHPPAPDNSRPQWFHKTPPG